MWKQIKGARQRAQGARKGVRSRVESIESSIKLFGLAERLVIRMKAEGGRMNEREWGVVSGEFLEHE